MRKPVEIVRMQPFAPVVMITGATKQEVAKKAGRGVYKGKYASVSEILPMSGGGYAAKARLMPEAPKRVRQKGEPLPMWARILIRIGWALAGIIVALALLTAALSALFGSLVNLPWMAIAGCLALLLILSIVCPPVRSAVTVIVKVFV